MRDRDSKFTRAFDEVFRSAASKVIRTPVKAPRANAYAERWVRTVRTECLDWLLILNQRHLERVLRVYVHHYNAERPHRGLKLSPPEGPREPMASAVQANVCRRDLLGGLLHEYYQAAADWLVEAVHRRLREELAKLDLRLNEEKSRIVDLSRGESFGFLGFDFRRVRSRRGRWRPQYTPKQKKRTALLRELKEVFRRSRSQPVEG